MYRTSLNLKKRKDRQRDREADSNWPLISTCEQSIRSSGGWSASVVYAPL